MKKLVSILLFVALAATLMVSSAFAAGTEVYIVSQTDVEADENGFVYVDVAISGNTKFDSGALVFKCSLPIVEITSTKITGSLQPNYYYVETKGIATCAFGLAGVSGDGAFLTLKLDASKAVAGEKYDIMFVEDTLAGRPAKSDISGLDETYKDGSITMKAGETPVDPPHTCVYDKEVVKDEYLKSAATCTEAAVYYKSCECGKFDNSENAATFTYGDPKGHTPVTDDAVAATCTEAGKTEGSHCSVCGEVLVAQEEIPATGHDWDEGEVTTDPGCTTKGVKTFTCKNDASHTKTEDIDPNGHKWGEWTDCDADPDCEHKGCHERVCSVCGETEDNEHTYGDWSAWVKNNDGKTETRTKACTVCGHEVSETQDVKEDKPVDPTPAPTDKPNKPDNSKKDDTKKAPKTGDESNLALWASVLLVACGSAVVVMTKKKEN